MASASMLTGQFTVGTASAKAVSAKTTGEGARIRNTHATNILYVGPTTSVDATTGYPIPPGQAEDFPYAGDIYVIGSAAGTTGGWVALS